MIYGADPDAVTRPWADEQPQYTLSPRLYRLVNYFGYHPPVRMHQRWTDEDRLKVAHLMARRLDQGFTPQALERMVDRFYQTSAADMDIPANAFTSEKVQLRLLEGSGFLTTNTPALDWLVAGMPPSPLFDHDLRKTVLALSTELTYRYPDVVASILSLSLGMDSTQPMLRAAERLVLWNLGADEVPGRSLLQGISLPAELASFRRAPKTLRIKSETMIQAVSKIPGKKPHDEWERQRGPRQAITAAWD